MRKILFTALLIVGTYLLQGVLGILLPSYIILPNLLLILTCSIGLMRGKRAGMLTGFFCGLLYDLFFGNIFGLTALCYMYAGFINGFLFKVFFDNDIRIPMASVAISDLACNLVICIANGILQQRIQIGAWLTGRIIPEMIASVAVTIPLYYFYRLVNSRLASHESEEQHSQWLRR